MYLSEVESVGVASEKKIQLLKRNFLGYFISAMLAGVCWFWSYFSIWNRFLYSK